MNANIKCAWLLVALALVGLIGAPVGAETLLSIDLSGVAEGDPIPTGPSANPITKFGYVGGYGTPAGTAVVSTVAGIGKAAVLTTDPGNSVAGAGYLDTGMNVTAKQLSLSFDINVLAQATPESAYGQTLPDGTPILYGVRLYSSSGGDWATTFNLSPTSATGGILAFRNADNTALQSLGTYTVGTARNVRIDLDYSAGTADAYVDGILAYSDYALRGGSQLNPTTNELFIHLTGSAGTANSVAIGNVELAVVPVPLAAWGGLALFGLIGVQKWRRARREQE